MSSKQQKALSVFLVIVLSTFVFVENIFADYQTGGSITRSTASDVRDEEKRNGKNDLLKPPVLSNVKVRPKTAHPGATIIFEIDFVEVPGGDLNGGIATITDSQGNVYEGLISDAKGTTGTCITSIKLSPLVKPGEIMFSIFGVDVKENSSNTVYAKIDIL